MKKVVLIDTEVKTCDTLLLTNEQLKLLMFLFKGDYLRDELKIFALSADAQFKPI